MANAWQRLVDIGRPRMAMRGKCLAMRGNAWHLVVGEDGPGRGHLCHTDTFLVSFKIVVAR